MKKDLDTYLSLCADYYDLDKPFAPNEALKFYLEYTHKALGSILEPMCGSGRFMIPFLQAGLDIQGFDASSSMLTLLQKKLAHQDLQTEIWSGFLEDFNRQEKYGFIFIPSGSFGLILDLATVRIALKNIYKHLKQEGLFVFEIETFQAIPKEVNVWKGDCRKKQDGKMIVLSYFHLPVRDNIGTTFCRYELIENNQILKTEIEEFRLRYYHPQELLKLLEEVGFKDIKMITAFEHGKQASLTDEVIVFECWKK